VEIGGVRAHLAGSVQGLLRLESAGIAHGECICDAVTFPPKEPLHRLIDSGTKESVELRMRR
jgi:hypothetical protein